jgi:hypothetical protein
MTTGPNAHNAIDDGSDELGVSLVRDITFFGDRNGY